MGRRRRTSQGRRKLTSRALLVWYIVTRPVFSFFQKEEAWTPLRQQKSQGDARDDIFMYIYTIATKTMGRYILHIAFFFGLEWRIGLLLGWDKTFRMLKIPPPSAACWCWRVLSPFLPFASVSGEWNGIAQRYSVSQQVWDPHCSKSSFFVQKFNFDYSWKCCGLGLFSCWQLWFHEKNCQKN